MAEVVETKTEEAVKETKKHYGIFQGTTGDFSMRRVLAFILALSCIASVILGLVVKAEWKVILVAGGILLLGCILLLFFTTWGDIQKVIKAVKGDDDE